MISKEAKEVLTKLASLRTFIFQGQTIVYCPKSSKFRIFTWSNNAYRLHKEVIGDLPKTILAMQGVKGKKRLFLDNMRLV